MTQVSKQILIIASEKHMQSFLTGHLGQMGLNCHIASTAKDGLELLRCMSPDLIVISDKLVDANGLDTAAYIKQNGQRDIPLITISYKEKDVRMPKAAHLTRPVSLTQLMELINGFFNEGGRTQWQTI